MARPTRLSESELHAALATLAGWTLREGKLHRSFHFADFSAAFGFMARVALAAEAMNHHPEWRNVYNRVTVDLATHDMDNAISTFDVELARKMESLAGKG